MKKPLIRTVINEDGKWWKNSVYQDKSMGVTSAHLRAICIGVGDKRAAELADEIDSYRGLDYRQCPRPEGCVDEST